MLIIAPFSKFDAPEFDELPIKRLSAAEALALRKLQPPVSPWRIVGLQAVGGLLAALAAWALTGRVAAECLCWLAMLSGWVGTLNVHWLALLMRPKRITD